jgi:hypothetical protein
MKKKVYLHVGFHKTGTTAIQESLFSHSDQLRILGINYATKKGKANHREAWALSERYWGWKKRGGEQTSIVEWQKRVKDLKSQKIDSVVSSEFFSEINDDQLNLMANDLKDFDVEVIFTIRPLAKLLGSSYQQYLKYGIKASYEEWLEDIFHNSEKPKFTPTFWKRHRHEEVISRWANAFGNQKIHLVVVDESEPDLLYDSFNKILKLPAGTLKEVKGLGSNRSLNYPEISLLLAINKAFPKDRTWSDYEVFIREGSIRHLTNQIQLGGLGTKLLTPQWAVDEVAILSSDSIAKISDLGIIIYGDLDKLNSTEILIGTNGKISEIPIGIAVNALLAFDKSKVINKYSTQEIFDEAVKRLKRIVRKFLKLT